MRKSSGALGSAIGGAFNWGKNLLKNHWPTAAMIGLQAYPLIGDYQQRSQQAAQQAAHPPGPGKATIPGANNLVSMQSNLGPKFGGDKHMTSTQVLDSFIERSRAYEWGAEQFCKKAGFDAEDTKIMLEFLKEAAPRFAMMRTRGGPAFTRIRGGSPAPRLPMGEPMANTFSRGPMTGIPGRGDVLSPVERAVLETERSGVGRASGLGPNLVGKPGPDRTPFSRSEDKLPMSGAKVTSPEEFSKAFEPPPSDPFAAAAAAGKAPPAPAVPKSAPAPVPTPAVAAPAVPAAATTPGGAAPVVPLEEATRGQGTPISSKTHKQLQEAFETTMGRGARRMPGGGSRVAARFRAQQGAAAPAGGGPGAPAGGEEAGAAAGGASVPQGASTMTAASGEAKPDRSWMPIAALLGGGYMAHGYGTEGGTYSMFDPPEVRKAKQDARNKSLGIGQPAAPAAGAANKFETDPDARDQSEMEAYLKRLRLSGPLDPRAAAQYSYGGATQARDLENFMYLSKKRGLEQRLRDQWGPEQSRQILDKLNAKTTGQTGGF